MYPGLQLDPWVSIQGFSLSSPCRHNGHYRLRYHHGSRLLHRTLMSVVIGMEVPSGYVVHHRDGDVGNNRLDNLALMTHGVHASHHNTQYPLPRTCGHCGGSFVPSRGRAPRPRQYCSRSCAQTDINRRRNPCYASNARPSQPV